MLAGRSKAGVRPPCWPASPCCRRPRGNDLAENYAEDVLLLSAEGIHHGHRGVRVLAGILRDYVPAGTYHYRTLLVAGDVGMLQWSASGESRRIHDGADTFVVRDGLIRAQSIHYSTAPPD